MTVFATAAAVVLALISLTACGLAIRYGRRARSHYKAAAAQYEAAAETWRQVAAMYRKRTAEIQSSSLSIDQRSPH